MIVELPLVYTGRKRFPADTSGKTSHKQVSIQAGEKASPMHSILHGPLRRRVSALQGDSVLRTSDRAFSKTVELHLNIGAKSHVSYHFNVCYKHTHMNIHTCNKHSSNKHIRDPSGLFC